MTLIPRILNLIQTRHRQLEWVSVNTTSAPSATSLCRLPQPHRLGIDRQCTHSLHRNDMAYGHFELCCDCGLGCFSELLLAGIRRLWVVPWLGVLVSNNCFFTTKHFWNFILMTQSKLCTRAAAVAVNKERSPMGPM